MDVTMLAIEEPTKEEVHLDLVRIIIRQAEVRPAYRMFPTGRGVVNALAPGEADRIVRHMAASDSAPEWHGIRRDDLRENLRIVFAHYRRMRWSVN